MTVHHKSNTLLHLGQLENPQDGDMIALVIPQVHKSHYMSGLQVVNIEIAIAIADRFVFVIRHLEPTL